MTSSNDTRKAEREAARANNMRLYNQYRQEAWECRERAMSCSYEPERRYLMARADELTFRAYHQVA